MRHSTDPRQIALFDPDRESYSEVALGRLAKDWPEIFRQSILDLMPVDLIQDRFHESMGRPTKELYSMCGLVFLMEFQDWTTEAAADAYMFDQRVHFALNLGHDRLSMTTRTIERYRSLFREEDVAVNVMDRVTQRLVKMLNLSTKRQRLDSTHVFSRMALFGRTRLMTTTVRRFLTQIRRHNADLFATVPEDLRQRHDAKNWEFGGGKDGQISREQVAEDMLWLIHRFADVPEVSKRPSFKDLVRVFEEQCEVREQKVAVREHVAAAAMQNPSDPDATRDGHKGAGYHVQVSETCAAENEVQLVVAAVPQTASENDQNAVSEVLDRLEENGYTPETVLADGGYGSDRNHQACEGRGVDLISPVNNGPRGNDRFGLEAFELDAQRRITRCPAGHAPVVASFDHKRGTGCASFEVAWCTTCEHRSECPAYRHHQKFRVKYDSKDVRLAQRRTHFKTPECREEYALRSGVEGLFSRAKAVTGLGHLRVRGRPAVFMAIYLKLAGLNILRALASTKIRKCLTEAMGGTWLHRQTQSDYAMSFAVHGLPAAA